MVFFIPVGHDQVGEMERWPWVSLSLMALCFLGFLLAGPGAEQKKALERQSVLREMLMLSLTHPEVELPEDVKRLLPQGDATLQHLREGLSAMQHAQGRPEAQEAVAREMEGLLARWRVLDGEGPFRRWGMIPVKHRPVTFITHQFLHGGWLHLLFNLYFFYLCGPFLEEVWGMKLFAGFYLMAGVVAGLMFWAHYPQGQVPLVGASGAISGVMGATLIRFWHSRIHFRIIFLLHPRSAGHVIPLPVWLILPFWLSGEIFKGLLASRMSAHGGPVAHWAHVWGFAFGVVVALLLKYIRWEERWVIPVRAREETYVNPQFALLERLRGFLPHHPEEAWACLQEVPAERLNLPELGEQAWYLARSLGRDGEAQGYLRRAMLLAGRDRNGALVRILHHEWRQAGFGEDWEIRERLLLAQAWDEVQDGAMVGVLLGPLESREVAQMPPGLLLPLARLARAHALPVAGEWAALVEGHPDIPGSLKSGF